MEVSRYPDLSLVKEEPPEPVPSPIIPILPSSAGKGRDTLAPPFLLTACQFAEVRVLVLKSH